MPRYLVRVIATDGTELGSIDYDSGYRLFSKRDEGSEITVADGACTLLAFEPLPYGAYVARLTCQPVESRSPTTAD
jgi:hypothetical protein